MLLSTRVVGLHNNNMAPHMIQGNLLCDVIINGVKLAVVTSHSYEVIDFFFSFLLCTCCIINETKSVLYGSLIFMSMDILRMQIHYILYIYKVYKNTVSKSVIARFSKWWRYELTHDWLISHRQNQQNKCRHVYSTFLKNILMDANNTNIQKHTHNCAKHMKCDPNGLNGTATREEEPRIMKTGNARWG
jgi:hypothetical protein